MCHNHNKRSRLGLLTFRRCHRRPWTHRNQHRCLASLLALSVASQPGPRFHLLLLLLLPPSYLDMLSAVSLSSTSTPRSSSRSTAVVVVAAAAVAQHQLSSQNAQPQQQEAARADRAAAVALPARPAQVVYIHPTVSVPGCDRDRDTDCTVANLNFNWVYAGSSRWWNAGPLWTSLPRACDCDGSAAVDVIVVVVVGDEVM